MKRGSSKLRVGPTSLETSKRRSHRTTGRNSTWSAWRRVWRSKSSSTKWRSFRGRRKSKSSASDLLLWSTRGITHSEGALNTPSPWERRPKTSSCKVRASAKSSQQWGSCSMEWRSRRREKSYGEWRRRTTPKTWTSTRQSARRARVSSTRKSTSLLSSTIFSSRGQKCLPRTARGWSTTERWTGPAHPFLPDPSRLQTLTGQLITHKGELIQSLRQEPREPKCLSRRRKLNNKKFRGLRKALRRWGAHPLKVSQGQTSTLQTAAGTTQFCSRSCRSRPSCKLTGLSWTPTSTSPFITMLSTDKCVTTTFTQSASTESALSSLIWSLKTVQLLEKTFLRRPRESRTSSRLSIQLLPLLRTWTL